MPGKKPWSIIIHATVLTSAKVISPLVLLCVRKKRIKNMGASHVAIGIILNIPFEKTRNINPMISQRYDQYSDFIFRSPFSFYSPFCKLICLNI